MKNIPLLHPHRYSEQCLKIAGFFAMLYAICLPLSLAAENIPFFSMLSFTLLSGDWRSKWQIIKYNPMAWFALALTLLYLSGVFYSNASWGVAFWIFKKQAELFFIVLLLPLFFENARLKLLCYRSFVVGAILAFIIGAFNMLGIFDLASLFQQHPQSPAFPVFFHIYGGIFLAFASFIALQLAYQEKALRWLYIACWLFISFDVLFMSIARTGYILYFALMLIFLLQKCSFKQLILGLLGIAVLFGAAYSFSHTFKSRLNQDAEGVKSFHSNVVYYSNTSGIRLEYAVKSYELWKKKPVFGYGTGGFANAYISVGGVTATGITLSTPAHPQISPENTFYFIAVEHGLFGLAILLAMLVVEWKSSFKLEQAIDRHIAQALVIGFILTSFSAPMLLDESPRLFFVFFTSLLFAALSKRT
ncbi:MAG: O-antigen ligase [Gammaproteobacteria bacterium]|jgi:hypothetical protein|nr:O-antigen ligase [Gammaproteobacteria bacterium]